MSSMPPDSAVVGSPIEPTAPTSKTAHPNAIVPPMPSGGTPATPSWDPPRRSLVVIVGACVIILIGVCSALYGWRLPPFAGYSERTENAYVRGRVTVISPQVSGYVTAVLAQDYSTVTAGDVLVRIDDRIYRRRVEQARAAWHAQIATLNNSVQGERSRDAALLSLDAGITNAAAQLQRAASDMRRADDLVSDGSVSRREVDQTRAALRQAQASVRQAGAARAIGIEDVRTVQVGRGGLRANVDAALAALHQAEIDLGHTVIRAPETGTLNEIGVRLGQYVTNGTQLLFLVPPSRWIIANYKEAQTARMQAGQPVRFSVDAFNGRELSGRVQRLSPAAGSEFAVLKPDNATGNFTKVPQRIGVRIAVDANQPLARRLRPGMSVVTTVDTALRKPAS